MVVKVKLKIRSLRSGKEVVSSAFVNSGFEAETLQYGLILDKDTIKS
ncbi:MAG: hypothetical protein QXT92_05995 [Nitrososphaerota archaeon]